MKNNRITYPLPTIIDPPERICVQLEIPAETWHIGAFLGAIYSLTRWYNWDRDENKTGKQVADVWQVIYDQLEPIIGLQGCGNSMNPPLRQNPESPCQMQYFNEYGEWVTFYDFTLCGLFTGTLDITGVLNYQETTIAIDTYIAEQNIYDTNPADYVSALNALAVLNRDKLLCYALRVYVLTFLETVARNKEEAEKNQITLSMIIGAGLALAFAPFTPLIVGAILTSFSAGAIIGVASVNQNELRDQTAQDKVLCHIYNQLQGDALTRANFANCLTPNPFDAGTPEYKQVEVLRNGWADTSSYLAIVSLMKLNLPYVDALVNECDICGNGNVWEHTFDFTTDSHSEFFSAITTPPSGYSLPENTAWVSGEGWGNGRQFHVNRQMEWVYIHGYWASTNITYMGVTYKSVAGTGGSYVANGNNVHMDYLNDTTYVSGWTVLPAQTVAGTYSKFTTIPARVMTGLRIQVSGYQKAGNSDPLGAQFLRSLTLKGTGINPFI